jgi:ABC-type transporter Mla MlaB component
MSLGASGGPSLEPHEKELRLSALEPSSIVFAVGGRIDRADIQQLCDALAELLAAADADIVICDVGALVRPDAVAVDALARLRLTACRVGSAFRVWNAATELSELVAFMGLSEPLIPEPHLQVTP